MGTLVTMALSAAIAAYAGYHIFKVVRRLMRSETSCGCAQDDGGPADGKDEPGFRMSCSSCSSDCSSCTKYSK